MSTDELKEIISDIQQAKVGKRHPEFVTLREITNTYPEAASLITQLTESGQLILGRTINDHYIKQLL